MAEQKQLPNPQWTPVQWVSPSLREHSHTDERGKVAKVTNIHQHLVGVGIFGCLMIQFDSDFWGYDSESIYNSNEYML